MSSSNQNEFMWGCLIGGALGATAALFLPKKFLNDFLDEMTPRKNNNRASHTAHDSHKQTAAHNSAAHDLHKQTAANNVPKKATTRRTLKNK